MKFRDNVIRFMGGRYGGDRLGTACMVLCAVLIVANTFIRSLVLYVLILALMGWSLYRTMSRNIYARRRENDKFMGICGTIRGKTALLGRMWRDRKTHVYRTCPNCKRTLRLPREKGRHTVECPCCHSDFECRV